MALSKRQMQSIIRCNGHLIIDGTESPDDLRKALVYLQPHTYARCHRPSLGTPIDTLLPDISVLAVKSMRSTNAQRETVVSELESL